jgi:hypothetical protein
MKDHGEENIHTEPKAKKYGDPQPDASRTDLQLAHPSWGTLSGVPPSNPSALTQEGLFLDLG